jgi:hypothetical protein
MSRVMGPSLRTQMYRETSEDSNVEHQGHRPVSRGITVSKQSAVPSDGSNKFETAPILRGLGLLIHEKNLKSKISFYCTLSLLPQEKS